MRQKLFTKQIDDMLFKQYAMGNELSKQKVVAKIFNPYGRGVWYLLNSDPSDPDYIWAIVDLFEIEVGSVSRESLEMMKVPPFGLNLERDIYFQPMNAGELLNRLYEGETFGDGGEMDSMSYAKTKGKESIDWDKELREYAGNNYSKLSEREKEEIISDMQKDFDRNYFADGGELQIIKNESGENYLASVNSTPNEMAVKLADGGKIKNQYEGRTPEDIWNNLSKEQRSHFIYDHAEEIEEYRGEEYGELSGKEIIKAYNSDYKDLDKNIRNRFDNHTREGQYARGGEIKVDEGDMIKSKNVKGKVYYSLGSMFKLEDEYGNKNPKYFSTKDFKKSEIIKMAKGGVTASDGKTINVGDLVTVDSKRNKQYKVKEINGKENVKVVYHDGSEYVTTTSDLKKFVFASSRMAKGGSITTFNPMQLIGLTFYTMYSDGNIVDVKIISNDNIQITYEKSKDSLAVTKSFTKKELYEMSNGKEVDGNRIFKSKMADGGYMEKEKNWFVIKNDDGTFSAYNSEIKQSEKEYDMTFKTELKAKNYIKKNYPKSKMANGGTTTSKNKAKSIAKNILKKKS